MKTWTVYDNESRPPIPIKSFASVGDAFDEMDFLSLKRGQFYFDTGLFEDNDDERPRCFNYALSKLSIAGAGLEFYNWKSIHTGPIGSPLMMAAGGMPPTWMVKYLAPIIEAVRQRFPKTKWNKSLNKYPFVMTYDKGFGTRKTIDFFKDLDPLAAVLLLQIPPRGFPYVRVYFLSYDNHGGYAMQCRIRARPNMFRNPTRRMSMYV